MLMALRLPLASGCKIIATFCSAFFGVLLAGPENKFGTVAFDLLHVGFVLATFHNTKWLIAIGNAFMALAKQ